MIGAPYHLAAVVGEHGAAIVALGIGDTFLAAAILIHGPQFQVAGGQRRVDDLFGFKINGALGVVASSISQLLDDLALIGSQINIKAGVDRPNVALAAV